MDVFRKTEYIESCNSQYEFITKLIFPHLLRRVKKSVLKLPF